MSEEIKVDELELLKQRADQMGITYHPNIKIEKLKEKIDHALAGEPEPVVEDKASKETPKVSEAEEKVNVQREAAKLVRIRLTCMNPVKKEWPGEIITVGNSVVGSYKKFVPFNADEGYHVPNIIYQFLKDRMCQVFYTERLPGGGKMRKGKMIKEFAIEVLPNLTEDELKALAAAQAAGRTAD